jgi:hypothetical protein
MSGPPARDCSSRANQSRPPSCSPHTLLTDESPAAGFGVLSTKPGRIRTAWAGQLRLAFTSSRFAMRASWCSNSCCAAIQERNYAAWSQGDVACQHQDPDDRRRGRLGGEHERVGARVDRVLGGRDRARHHAQFESVARLVAAAPNATWLPIKRSIVVTHADINSVSRRNDPWPPATREARVKRIISRNTLLRPPTTSVTVKGATACPGSLPHTG